MASVNYPPARQFSYIVETAPWRPSNPNVKPIGEGRAIGRSIIEGEVDIITINHKALDPERVNALRRFYTQHQNDQIIVNAAEEGQIYSCIWLTRFAVSRTKGPTKNVRVQLLGWAPSNPDSILDFEVAAPPAGLGILRAAWTVPNDNGSLLTGYEIDTKLPEQAWVDATRHTVTDPTAEEFDITGLTGGFRRDVRIRATNIIGAAGWSPTVNALPGAVPVPVSDLDFTVTIRNNIENNLNLTWVVPTQPFPLTRVRVGLISATGGLAVPRPQDWVEVDVGATEWTRNLPRNSAYTAFVELSNAHGTVVSNGFSVNTFDPVDPVNPPLTFTASPRVNSIRYNWSSVQGADAYIFEYRNNDASPVTSVNKATLLNHTLSGLSSRTSRQARVGSQNRGGTRFTEWRTDSTTGAGTFLDPFRVTYDELVQGVSTAATIAANTAVSEWWFEVEMNDANSNVIYPVLQRNNTAVDHNAYTVEWQQNPVGWVSDSGMQLKGITMPTDRLPSTINLSSINTIRPNNGVYRDANVEGRVNTHRFKITAGDTFQLKNAVTSSSNVLVALPFTPTQAPGVWRRMVQHSGGTPTSVVGNTLTFEDVSFTIKRNIRRLPIANDTIYYAIYLNAYGQASEINSVYTRWNSGSFRQGGDTTVSLLPILFEAAGGNTFNWGVRFLVCTYSIIGATYAFSPFLQNGFSRSGWSGWR